MQRIATRGANAVMRTIARAAGLSFAAPSAIPLGESGCNQPSYRASTTVCYADWPDLA